MLEKGQEMRGAALTSHGKRVPHMQGSGRMTDFKFLPATELLTGCICQSVSLASSFARSLGVPLAWKDLPTASWPGASKYSLSFTA